MPVVISMIDLGNWKITATFGNNNNNNNNNFVDERNYMDEEIDRLDRSRALMQFTCRWRSGEIGPTVKLVSRPDQHVASRQGV